MPKLSKKNRNLLGKISSLSFADVTPQMKKSATKSKSVVEKLTKLRDVRRKKGKKSGRIVQPQRGAR